MLVKFVVKQYKMGPKNKRHTGNVRLCVSYPAVMQLNELEKGN